MKYSTIVLKTRRIRVEIWSNSTKVVSVNINNKIGNCYRWSSVRARLFDFNIEESRTNLTTSRFTEAKFGLKIPISRVSEAQNVPTYRFSWAIGDTVLVWAARVLNLVGVCSIETGRTGAHWGSKSRQVNVISETSCDLEVRNHDCWVEDAYF